jgi:hypothetical protein
MDRMRYEDGGAQYYMQVKEKLYRRGRAGRFVTKGRLCRVRPQVEFSRRRNGSNLDGSIQLGCVVLGVSKAYGRKA